VHVSIAKVAVEGGDGTILYSETGNVEDFSEAGNDIDDVDLPTLLAIGGDRLFAVFLGPGGASLRSVSTVDGAMQTLVEPDGYPDVRQAAADSTSVYWTESGPDDRLLKVSQTDGTLKVLAEDTTGGSLLGAFGLDASYAYFDRVYLSDEGPNGTDDLNRVPLQGGPAETLISHSHKGPWGTIGVQDDVVFVTDGLGYFNFELAKVPVTGGELTKVARVLDAGLFVVDPMGFYVSVGVGEDDAGEAKALVKIPLAGGIATTIAATGGVAALATNETYVFWVDDVEGTVMRACK
jgi:hypothetical protein